MLDKVQQMISIYDQGHKRIQDTFIKSVKSKKLEVCAKLSALTDHKFAIAHVSCEQWEDLITKYSDSNHVRMRVTTDGTPSNKPPTRDKNGVYIFHLVMQTGDLTEEDWKKILSGLSDSKVVRDLVNGGDLNQLKRFFVHEVQEHLSALALLCEGYLAVHAEDTDISSTLDLMGWTEFRKLEKGQNLGRQDLSNKKSIVQCSQWWLDVFERESFDDAVKKEWKYKTRTEEIPTALNGLLEAILEGDTVVPPKMVADAYCVLVKEKIETTPSEWPIRRKKFYHDWLKNRFLNSFDDFIEQLQKDNPGIDRVSEFLVEDFPAWKSKRQDAEWIIQSIEDGMSPRRLLSCAPLSGCDVETQEWLGHLVHGLWLSRYPIKEKAKESQEALALVDELYEKIACELEQSSPIKLTQLIALRPQFCELRETYGSLSKSLSNLRRYESYGG